MKAKQTGVRYQQKISLIQLIREHKASCNGKKCTVSFLLLRMLAEDAGVIFTKDERLEFL